MKPTLRFHVYFVAACALFSFALSAILSQQVFERLPHLEDELAYVYQARILARGQLTVETPEPRLAFWQPFVIDRNGQRFGKYPLGFPAQLALGETAGAPWMVNALLGALSVALIYRLGSDVFGRRTGMFAALLLAYSPIAMLLNATLMGHTSALAFTLLFMWAYRRIVLSTEGALPKTKSANDAPTALPRHLDSVPSTQHSAPGWSLLAGFALGMVVANRPLAAVGIGLPYIAWSLLRLWAAHREGWGVFWRTLQPLLILGMITLLFAATIPLFSLAATGDAATNLYTLVWSYDRVGFGECCGRSGHSLERAFNHLRYDLTLLAADLHGLQVGAIDAMVTEHLLTQADSYPNTGLSFALPLLGVGVTLWRRRGRLALWLVAGAVWLALPHVIPGEFRSSVSAWVWVVGAGVWVLAVLCAEYWVLRKKTPANQHSLGPKLSSQYSVLLAVTLMPIVVHMTYWVGSQRYSTRYYYEGVGAIVLFSACGLAWLTRWMPTRWALGIATLACVATLVTYSLPRIGVLHGFNNVSQSWIDEARTRAVPGERLLVIVTGTDLSWRALGSFMAVTSPYLDGEIVGVYNRVQNAGETGLRDVVIARFPEHTVIDLTAAGAEAAFAP